MLKLMKYESLRKLKLFFIALVIIAIVEIAIVYTLYKGEGSLPYTSLLIFFLGFGGLVFILVDNITMYSSDLTKKHGYMIFLAPRNGYQVLGSKVVIGFLELIIGFVIYFALMFLNYTIFYNLYVEDKEGLFSTFFDIFGNALPNAFQLFMILLALMLTWFSFILMIYLAITLRKTLLSNVKFAGIISFVFFIVLAIVINYIKNGLYKTFGFNDVSLVFGDPDFYNQLISGQITASYIIDSIFILIMFFTSGYLLNKRVDV